MNEGSNINSDSQISISFDQEEFDRIYTSQLKKKEKDKEAIVKVQKQISKHSRNIGNDVDEGSSDDKQQNGKENIDGQEEVREQNEVVQQNGINSQKFVYEIPEQLKLDATRFDSYIMKLPIFKKKEEILNNIIKNQVVLVTGETGCGKSTQVPRLLYEYIKETNLNAKIICVQPRRLAVKNLHKILTDQIPEKGAVGYHIAMQTFIKENTKILFMTNGIFLQRLVHGTQFFSEYPFIILDEVHERDIDTDFILLSMKRLIRKFPKLRVILMSATIDNKLFQYYFAEDQIDSFMTRQNYYKKFIKLQEQIAKFRRQEAEEQEGYRIERIGQDEQLYKKIQMQYLNSKFPCPTVNVTQKGKFKKMYYYLDTIKDFLKQSHNIRSGCLGFQHRSPMTNKELYEDTCVIIDKIMSSLEPGRDRSNQSVLVFLPGLGQIEILASEMQIYFGKRISNFQIIKCHSSILNDDTTKRLHNLYRDKFKIIIATNIAESSITVLGVKYVVDFCLTKEINFNQKSRMENLELVWASKASCQQRAGRTGRVCDGYVFRMVQQGFYSKLSDYSTPQIQRSSLDKIILRIKLIHQNQVGNIFEDPGQVLGTAIQPPNLKHIDQSIKSLILCGGLRVQEDKLILTKLGRIYVDIPLDIIYSKMLIFSLLMGTFQDILILVCILSQNKNAFRRAHIQRNPIEYFEVMSNSERCDFLALINAYKNKHYNKGNSKVELDIYYETRQLIEDVSRRIKKRELEKKIFLNQSQQDKNDKFKITLAFGFLSHLIRVRPMVYDDRQQKRHKLMKKQGVSVRNTIVLLNSESIRKSPDQNQSADNRMRENWIKAISDVFKFRQENLNMTLGSGISFLHFKEEVDLNKFLFVKFMEKKKNLSEEKNYNNLLGQLLAQLGDIDYMQQGNPCQIIRDHKVTIDNFSSNRIISIPKQNQSYQFPSYRYLLSNNITQHNSKLSSRFATLLPDIQNIEILLHLLFYPFIVILPDRKRTKYDSLFLKKKCKLYINYQLTDQQIQEGNFVRGVIRELMDLSLFLEGEGEGEGVGVGVGEGVGVVVEPVLVDEMGVEVVQQDRDDVLVLDHPNIQPQNDKNKGNQEPVQNPKLIKRQDSQISIRNQQRIQKMQKFWPKLKQFLQKQRKPTLQQQKWQQIYFQQQKIVQQSIPVLKTKPEQPHQYMNKIQPFPLSFSYFSTNYKPSSLSSHPISREQRVLAYEKWKLKKYSSILEMENIGLDHNPYVVCSQCELKITKLSKLGPMTGQYFREMFQVEECNVRSLVYNQFGDHFCSMLMTVYMDREYDVYGCKNGHHLAIKFRNQKKLKLLTFSPISILYPDSTVDPQPEFQDLQFKKWRQRAQKSKANKLKKPLTAPNNMCFVCGDTFKNVKELQAHIKNQYHQANVRDFRNTLALKNKVKEIQDSFNKGAY